MFQTSLIRKLLRLLVRIDQILGFCIIVSLIMFLLGYYSPLRYFLFISTTLLVGIGIIPTGQWLCVFLENRFSKPSSFPSDAAGIIVLGSGFDLERSKTRQTTCYNRYIGRLIEFIALAKLHPQLKSVFTGGGALIQQGINESQIATDLFKKMGLNIEKIVFETESRDTIENAHFTYKLIQPTPEEKWILLTSANHMPRSVGLFQAIGWNIIPYPVDYHTNGKYAFINFNIIDNFDYWWYGMHELIEMLNNYLSGQSKVIISNFKKVTKP